MRTEIQKDILIVEDEEVLCEILQEFLTKSGYNIDIVQSAEDALALFLERKYRLLISDIHLPQGIDGIELTERIHSINSEIPVILMTGYNVHKVKNIVKEKSISDFIEKPFKPLDLLPLIEKHFNNE